MSHNMDYLHRKKIIYKRQPLNDEPTAKYKWGWYYENGTYEYYSLFHSKSIITSYKSLKWHLHVLFYLNPNLNENKFTELAKYISNKENGFEFIVITFISEISICISLKQKLIDFKGKEESFLTLDNLSSEISTNILPSFTIQALAS